jgi:lysophospholipase L1-like esterase
MAEFLTRFVGALWNVVGIILLALLVAEFGVNGGRRLVRRWRYGAAGKPDERIAADAYAGVAWAGPYFAELVKFVRLDWAPFVQWRQRPFRGTYFTIDEQGWRATPGGDGNLEGAVSVHCFGGSTMFGVGARAEWTIPALLQRHLGEAGHQVAVVNRGQLGYVSTQEAIALQQTLKFEPPPEIVVFYDGFNDMLTAEWTGRAGAMLSEEMRAAEFGLFAAERRGDLARAALVGALPRTLRRLRRWTGMALRGSVPRPQLVPLSEAQVAPLARAVIDAYAANVRMVRLLAGAYGFRTVFFWQPALASKKIKTAAEHRFEGTQSLDPGVRRRLVAACADSFRRHPDLAGSPDAFDLSALFDDESKQVYIDFGHLTEAGNDIVAAAMLPVVKAAVGAAAAQKIAVAPRMGGD